MHTWHFPPLLLILTCSNVAFSLGAVAHSALSVSGHPSCPNHESSALLHFKQSFLIDCAHASHADFAYPRANSWENGQDCCLWEGLECDEETGHVIGLDLSSSCLYGNFPSHSSLFSLIHLQELNLHDNDFNSSPIPSKLGHLTNLRSLDLSYSGFSGQIPLEILKLSKLSVLELSWNNDLSLTDVSLEKFVRNFTDLTHLGLHGVDTSSPLPTILANFTSLEYLSLSHCNLNGWFPSRIFGLPRLEEVYIYENSALKGFLPDFQPNSRLTAINVASTAFRGPVPRSIGQLARLEFLKLNNCSFSGSIPSSVGKLKKLAVFELSENHFSGGIPSSLGKLDKLTVFDLSENQFSGGIPSSLGKLKNLTYFDLSENHFSGGIPSSLANLTQLQHLSLTGMNLATEIPSFIANFTRLEYLTLDENQLIGQIPLWLMNLTQLQDLSLYDNHLKGPIPEEITQLVNLEKLDFSENDNLHGNFDLFLKLQLLTILELGGVNLAFLGKATSNESHPQLSILILSSCNLVEFPQFLRSQNELEHLVLSKNKIGGLVPQWLENTTRGSLYILDLSHNFLTGFEHPMNMFPWNCLEILDLSSNQLQGSLPIPPTSMKIFQVSNNRLEGNIPLQICLATSLRLFDISNNTLSGHIPNCISELVNSLVILNLRGNNFNGIIPRSYSKSCALKMINLSQNQLEGTIPKSMANCTMLVVLDIGQNRMNDTFPSWLGSLPHLQVLVLRHNNFHGSIRAKSKLTGDFQSLRIIDLSHNFHIGDLPSDYLQIWDAMKIVRAGQSNTSGTTMTFVVGTSGGTITEDFVYDYSIMITSKGNNLLYTEIWEVFMVIDFSSNHFIGRIPDSVGELRGLQALNFSNNNLVGGIPSSFSNISGLESLDLSMNKLSGGIPAELAKLTFLEVFNVSHNLLTGPIPQGNQFDAFDNSSFDGNPGLCGSLLSNKCGDVHHESPPSPPVVSSNEEEDSDVIDWIIRALGCLGGFIVGCAIGKYLTDQHHDWFVETFGRKRRPRKRRQGAPRRRT